jgi:pimeloyl-ACP methyl ester carboxylesterase
LKHLSTLISKKTIAIAFSVILALYVGVSILGASAAMHIPRIPLNGSPADVGLRYQDAFFNSRVDNIPLEGWFIPSSGDSAIIIVHGGFQNRVDPTVDTLDLARDLVAKGYNILLFDLRGRGNSGGIGRSLTNADRDIGGAVDYLINKGYTLRKIGAIGYCSGAANACIFASEQNIGALVLDGCFISVREMVYNEAAYKGIPRLPVDIFIPGVLFASQLFYRYQAVNPIDVIEKVNCPIFFIHEEEDTLVSNKDVVRLAKAAGYPANAVWEVKNTDHALAYQNYHFEYVTRVSAFFDVTIGMAVTR